MSCPFPFLLLLSVKERGLVAGCEATNVEAAKALKQLLGANMSLAKPTASERGGSSQRGVVHSFLIKLISILILVSNSFLLLLVRHLLLEAMHLSLLASCSITSRCPLLLGALGRY